MSAVSLAVVVVLACAAFLYFLFQWMETENHWWGVALGVLLTAVLAVTIHAMQQEDEKGPCLREATGYAYNAATKTTMPYTYCAERGTWTDGGAS